MNWGTKIVIGLAIFMISIVALGIIMTSGKKDALVENDYYEKGINYDKDYNREEQMKHDHAQPELLVSKDKITITFKDEATGTAKLIRMADKNLDRKLTFSSDAGNQVVIPSAALQKGSWKLSIEWISKEKSYLYEQEITI
ncbi:FixH family protein [Pedobacter sp. L105]|uniref:FixH family protein n=1 Tax=Pedobacter sp. L105 TaxID=1641871 RepID=UPI00131D11B1|nr:FixH family protein [Pedobacter sp. L105]